jgi:hypothetical protein
MSLPLLSDGSYLIASCLVLPRPVQPRPSRRCHLVGVLLVAVEFEALLGRRQVKAVVVFVAYGSLVSRNLWRRKTQQRICVRRRYP